MVFWLKMEKHLEISEKLTTILFDKTGTLTIGKPEVTDIIGYEMDEAEILRYAASVEASSEHPLGAAIVQKAKKDGLDLLEISEFNSFGGKGVKAIVNEREIIIGNRLLFSDKDH